MYYTLDESIVPDHRYDAWSRELVEIQAEHPHLIQGGYRPDLFADWTGETGYHLPQTEAMVALAHQLLESHKERQRA